MRVHVRCVISSPGGRAGMVGVHGTASAIFTTVRDAAANVIMISQASSEHSVCFAVKQAEADRAVDALNHRWVLLGSGAPALPNPDS